MNFDGRSLGISNRVQVTHFGSVMPGQDGVIWGDYLFRFGTRGDCKVHALPELKEIAAFQMGKKDLICTHNNAVCFGSEYYAEGDEFPLLYSNVYNNYADAEDRMEGVCCAYRLTRRGTEFSCDLVQVIRIGFTEDLSLWKSVENNGDVRPYGNFVVDRDRGMLHAFVMRDKPQTTQYFTFALPGCSEGVPDETYGVNVVTLTPDQILSSFDTEYSRYMQGACCHDGLIYSLEGFGSSSNRPKMQIIDPAAGVQHAIVDLWGMGLKHEPEFVDFRDGVLYYCDGLGNVYTLTTR